MKLALGAGPAKLSLKSSLPVPETQRKAVHTFAEQQYEGFKGFPCRCVFNRTFNNLMYHKLIKRDGESSVVVSSTGSTAKWYATKLGR